MAKKYRIKQVRSKIGQTERVKKTLSSLGLGRVGKESVHNAEDATVLGKLKKVEHLVYITEEK